MANGKGREGMYGTIVKWKYFPRKGKRAAVITVVEYNETGRNRCLDGAIDVTFPIASFPSSSFSSFMLSNFSLSLSPLAIAQDTSLENKLDLFIGVIKKTKKKESVVTRSVKNQNCHFIRAMNLFFFHRFQLYTGSPNFTFRFFPDSFLLFLFPSPLPLPVCHISRKNGKQHGNDKRAVR